jgi:hypothetical protein
VPCIVNHPYTDHLSSIRIPEDLERGKRFENSYFIPAYKVYYTGEWKLGRPHGVGEVVFENGSMLKATFVNGRVKGNDCLLVMENGSFYQGGIEDNGFSGQGKFTEENGHTYEGDWKNNKPHGNGKEIFANNDTYRGPYIEGKKEGPGVGIYTWS